MEKIKATILLAGAFVLGAATVADAQIRTGTREVSFSGSFTDNDTRLWNVTGYYGYFYNQQLEILGIGNLQGASGEDTAGSFGPGLDWHFMDVTTQNFVPYAGVSYLIGIDDVEDTLEGHVGIKQFVAESVAVKYQLGYGFDPGDTSESAFRASVGLSFFF